MIVYHDHTLRINGPLIGESTGTADFSDKKASYTHFIGLFVVKKINQLAQQ